MSTHRLREILGIELPIVQAPMSWLTNAVLVAAVSEAGGLGVLGANAGQSVVSKSIEETKERMRAEVRKVKSLTSKPFALNLLFGRDMTYSNPMIDLAIEEAVPVLAVVLVDDTDYRPVLARLKEAGIKVMLRPATPTIANARQAEDYGVDVYVATGYDSGGLAPQHRMGILTLLPMIRDAVQEMPILAAGGIGDERTVRAALALGASGVYVGTAFMVAEENPLARNVKELMLATNAEDLHFFESSMGCFRSVPTALSAELVAMNEAGAPLQEVSQKQLAYRQPENGLISGNFENEYINAGLSIGMLHKISPAGEIVRSLMNDYLD